MRTKWIILIIVFIAIGFFQELVKVNINYIIENGYKIEGFYQKSAAERTVLIEESKNKNPFDYYHSHKSLPIFNYLSENQLKALKWVLTVVFVVVFFLLNRKALSWIIEDSRYKKWLLMTYTLTFISALAIFSLGTLFGYQDLFYNISRKMVGALQSPVPAMMNWAGWKLYDQQNNRQE